MRVHVYVHNTSVYVCACAWHCACVCMHVIIRMLDWLSHLRSTRPQSTQIHYNGLHNSLVTALEDPLEALHINKGELRGDEEEQHEVGHEAGRLRMMVLEQGVGVAEVDTARMCMTSPHGALWQPQKRWSCGCIVSLHIGALQALLHTSTDWSHCWADKSLCKSDNEWWATHQVWRCHCWRYFWCIWALWYLWESITYQRKCFRDLLQDKIYGCGTYDATRKCYLKVKVNSGIGSHGNAEYRQDGNMLVTLWQDTKTVSILSTNCQPHLETPVSHRQKNGSRVDVPFPESIRIRLYNQFMSGVDENDHLRDYAVRSKSRKSYKYISWFLF